MENRKILFVISLVESSLAFEWFFRELSKTEIQFEIVFLNAKEPGIAKYCRRLNIKVYCFKYSGKKDFPLCFIRLCWLLFSKRIKTVHAHLFDASLMAIMAAKIGGVPNRIHTRHHASQHHLYNQHAVKYDHLINKHSTHIVAISEGIKNILLENEKVPAQKITVVHHGFDLNYFEEVNVERINYLKKKYDLGNANPTVGVISRWTHWKGIQYIIPAFRKLRQEFPLAILLLANAKGEYEKEIEELLTSLPFDSYRKIVFEVDTPALYHLMDVFVHVPIDDHSEAFGQVYVEALAAGVPSVFTLSGIANEFVYNRANAIVVPYQNAAAITSAISEILSNSNLKQSLIANGKKDVAVHFDIIKMINKMKTIYE